MTKMTLPRMICLWIEELNTWIRASVPIENRKKKKKKKILKYKNRRFCNSKFHIIFQNKYIQHSPLKIICFLLFSFEDEKKNYSGIQTQVLSLIIKNKSRQASVFSRVAFQKGGIGSNSYQILKENNVVKNTVSSQDSLQV